MSEYGDLPGNGDSKPGIDPESGVDEASASSPPETESPAYLPLGVEGDPLPTFTPEGPELPLEQDPGRDGALESPLPGAGDLSEESSPPGKGDAPASFSFSLMIEGPLKPEEREKLLDVLSRENLGIREVDLEPQFESGRVLIPRISEYAGILLVQALRNARASMRLGPSERIFATESTRDEGLDGSIGASSADAKTLAIMSSPASLTDPSHPAEAIAISTAPSMPNILLPVVIDTVTASATLTGRTVEMEESGEYQQVLDNLQRELKFKAFRKGAEAIVGFKIQLTPLHVPTQYRLLLSGVAIRSKGVVDNPGSPLPSADDLGGPGSTAGGGELSL